MTEERCETCRFARYREGYFDCRRNAPSAVLALFVENDNLMAWWPRVFAEDWCGEYEAKSVERPRIDQATCEHPGWMAQASGPAICVHCGLVNEQKWDDVLKRMGGL